MRIGIFGGSFNPPHKMHKDIAVKLLESEYLDKIIFVPTGNNYNKPGLLDGKDRLTMLKLIAENYNKKEIEKNNDNSEAKLESLEDCQDSHDFMSESIKKIEVSDFEVNGSLYTINTLKHFKNIYPDDEIYFICGTDNLAEFYTWRNYEEILKNYKILVIARKNNDFNDIIKMYSKYSENIILADIEMRIISSTIVRREILENGFTKKIKEYLDESVIEYLKTTNIINRWKIENNKHKKL